MMEIASLLLVKHTSEWMIKRQAKPDKILKNILPL